jgi:hypothetical protein
MAVAGGATTAFWFTLRGDDLKIEKTTVLRDLCDSVEDGLDKVKLGQRVTISGDDAVRFRTRCYQYIQERASNGE